MQKIFVQIASYRDPELQPTLEDLFKKAKHPENINVGICLQVYPDKDTKCYVHLPEFQDRISIVEYDASESCGACWARSEAQSLWNNEDYVLQIDSHMRFEPFWDETLIDMIKICPSDKAVISNFPPHYDPPNKCKNSFIYWRNVPEKFDPHGTLHLDFPPQIHVNGLPRAPIPHALIYAGFVFSHSSLIKDIPYDPFLYFTGDEMTLSVRLWTHGWDFFSSNKPLIYHHWGRTKRPMHFKDNLLGAIRFDKKARRRIRHLLDIELSDDPNVTQDIDKYGLGTIRTIDEYQEYAGINFKEQKITHKALRGNLGVYKTPS